MMSEKNQKKQRKTWAADDENLLLELWADKQAGLIGQRKNSHVYKEMAEIMVGYTPEEIKVKIHNLTNRYRKEKKLVGPSGGSPSQWSLYLQINAILGERPLSNVQNLQEDSIMESIYSTQESSQDSLSEIFSPPATAVVPSAASSASTSTAAASTTPAALSSPDVPCSSNSTAGKKRKRSHRDEEFQKQDEIIFENFKLIRETDEKLILIEEKRNAILERIAKSCESLQQDFALSSQRSFLG